MTDQKSKTLTIATVFICLVCLAGCQKAVLQHEFHRTPDRWEEPRIFQTSIEYSGYPWDEKIKIEKYDEIDVDDAGKIYSPNEAYWLQKQFSEKGTFQVVIFNEHRFIIIDTSSDDHYSKEVRWINEKLVYIRDWFGKVLGFDMIYDIEKEEVLYFEETNDGGLPFLQWQQNNISKSN
ncbi:MAG: hypothetical protein OEV87_06835 [Phycisphaerae bacterium]|nr:hypothetical protein [Phycisphaerae bacterium]